MVKKFLNPRGQMKIQQMSLMILAVFLFFVLAGLFFLRIQFRGLKGDASHLQKEQSISSLEVIADMPELNYDSSDSMTLDEDKLRIMPGTLGDDYSSFWPVASIEVYRIYPKFDKIKECPGPDCNYYKIYDNGQKNKKTYSTYVSICKKVKESGSTYDRCKIGKLVVGVIDYEK